jgi:hypothetical protein
MMFGVGDKVMLVYAGCKEVTPLIGEPTVVERVANGYVTCKRCGMRTSGGPHAAVNYADIEDGPIWMPVGWFAKIPPDGEIEEIEDGEPVVIAI